MEGQRCSSCGLLNPEFAITCNCGHYFDVPAWVAVPTAPRQLPHRPVKPRHSTMRLLLGMGLLMMSLAQITGTLAFHIILSEQGLVLIPKERLTFAHTFIRLVTNADDQAPPPLSQRADPITTYLLQKLHARKILPLRASQ